jgi:hypothetical protein
LPLKTSKRLLSSHPLECSSIMPFGLCNAAQTLQRMPDQIFKDLPCTIMSANFVMCSLFRQGST